MEQIARAEPDRSSWRRKWSVLGLAALLLAVLIVNYRVTSWALVDLFAAPLALLAVPLLLLVPGLALLRWLWPFDLAPAERWPLAIGISAVLPPLIFLASEPLGLRWNTWLCWAYLAVAALAWLWPSRGTRSIDRQAIRDMFRLDGEHALLIVLTLAALAVRLYNARDLPVGLWGDSYQHTMMAQLLVDHGGLFSSWQPYAPLTTFTYHFGFHSLVAWLHWLSGMPVTRGLLVIGQVESALAVPVVYLLARRLIGDPRAALWAALIAGFVSAMPAYYINWGRYTQLAGQTVLPAVCVVWLGLLEAATARSVERRRLLGPVLLAAIVTSGIVLTHYRVAIFGACFVAVAVLYILATRVRSIRALLLLCGVALAVLALTLLIIAPWIIRVREGALLKLGSYFLSNNIGADATNDVGSLDLFFSLYAKIYLVALALLGTLLLVARRHWRGLLLVGWCLLVVLAANPYLVGLNGAGILTNFAVYIAGYLILAPLAGLALSAIGDWVGRWWPAIGAGWSLQLVAGALVLIWGVGWQQSIVSKDFQLCTPADIAAMQWIRESTPPDAKFFVNSFPAYSNTLYAGSDGGWWLAFLAGRATNLPPLTQGSEAAELPDYPLQVNALNSGIERYPVGSPQAAAALRAAGFSYLYNGPAAAPPGEYVDPKALARSSLYDLVYDHDGVTIWRIR